MQKVPGVLVLLISSLFSLGEVKAQSSEFAGGTHGHLLVCGTPQGSSGAILGVSYALGCDTRAVEPRYSLVGCSLLTRVVYPGARPAKSPLQILAQDAEVAVLRNEAHSIKVTLDKLHMEAILTIGTAAKTICLEKRRVQ